MIELDCLAREEAELVEVVLQEAHELLYTTPSHQTLVLVSKAETAGYQG